MEIFNLLDSALDLWALAEKVIAIILGVGVAALAAWLVTKR